MSIREGLLALLAEQPKHGYQLKQEFEASTAGVWPLNIGQVYTTLDRLERDGLVQQLELEPGAEGRKQYRITDDGRRELEDWFSVAPDGAPQRDGLIIKVLVALHTAGVDPQAVIATQRAALLSTLQEHRRAQRKAAGALNPARPQGAGSPAAPNDADATTAPSPWAAPSTTVPATAVGTPMAAPAGGEHDVAATPPPAATDPARPTSVGRGGNTSTEELSAALLFDALVSRVEADLRWLDLCEERLLRHPTPGSIR